MSHYFQLNRALRRPSTSPVVSSLGGARKAPPPPLEARVMTRTRDDTRRSDGSPRPPSVPIWPAPRSADPNPPVVAADFPSQFLPGPPPVVANRTMIVAAIVVSRGGLSLRFGRRRDEGQQSSKRRARGCGQDSQLGHANGCHSCYSNSVVAREPRVRSSILAEATAARVTSGNRRSRSRRCLMRSLNALALNAI
jgi:hypothetical protein